ncbi:hypothetical protein [Pseudonocardia sp. ICBG1142]|uniref:hypothetical protein n=1 Tax=Pseudonocardia sp. ICBG1142 TaxID=2846760 RepID=UPI001CF6CC40|nr:hypothetical protein [Pseudonocardia sp. ICBG1142]
MTELDRRAGEMEEVEAARGRWLLCTAVDRDKHDPAVIALAHRNSDRADPDERVTAKEWLTAHDEAMHAEDDHRPITEHDLHDTLAVEHQALDDSPVLETAVSDVRGSAAAEPREQQRTTCGLRRLPSPKTWSPGPVGPGRDSGPGGYEGSLDTPRLATLSTPARIRSPKLRTTQTAMATPTSYPER